MFVALWINSIAVLSFVSFKAFPFLCEEFASGQFELDI